METNLSDKQASCSTREKLPQGDGHNNSKAHWGSVAQQWKYFGPPLRPSQHDIQYMENVIAKRHGDHKDGITVKLCGVTPEIATMIWPEKTRLIAVEQSLEMIQEVWPGDIGMQRNAVQGNWLEQHIEQGQYDAVVGDGCFVIMKYPEGYDALAATLAATLKNNGTFIMRFFTQIEQQESYDHVLSELLAGKIGTFHAFKWRLAMSLQKSSQQGIRLHDIFLAWEQAGIDEDELLAKTSWSREAMDTIKLYENKQNSLAFATLPEIDSIFEKYFHKEAIYFPPYELGERCPIITYRPLNK